MIPPPIHTAGPRVPIAGGWSKEDDLGLMDNMKKHKNVKNWEPIAKKLNRGKRYAIELDLSFWCLDDCHAN